MKHCLTGFRFKRIHLSKLLKLHSASERRVGEGNFESFFQLVISILKEKEESFRDKKQFVQHSVNFLSFLLLENTSEMTAIIPMNKPQLFKGNNFIYFFGSAAQ